LQAGFITRNIAKYFAADAKVAPISMTIHPPLPEQSWPPTISAYCLKPVTFFFPMRLYPSLVSNVPCPIAGCSQRTQLKGHSRPRWVYSLQQTELLVCSVHYCRAHSKEFNAVDAIPRMPEIVGSTFPFVVTTSAAVTKECVLECDDLFLIPVCRLLQLCRSWFPRAGFSTLSSVLQQQHHDFYHSRALAYYRSVERFVVSVPAAVAAKQQFPMFPPFPHDAFGGQGTLCADFAWLMSCADISSHYLTETWRDDAVRAGNCCCCIQLCMCRKFDADLLIGS
jgi:hypothetical protein